MKNIKINKADFLFIFVYINIFCKSIGLSNDSIFYKISLIIGVIFLAYKIMNENYTKNEMIKIIILLLIGIFSLLKTKRHTLFLTCICIIGMKNINLNNLFRGLLKIRTITFITVITLSLLGILENQSIKMWRNGKFDLRYSLGYGHPNSLHLTLFVLVCTYIYVRYDKFKKSDYLYITFLNLFVYKYSLSRTGVLLIFLLLILVFISQYKFFSKLIINSCNSIFLLLLTISFTFAIIYGKIDIANRLDILLNGRIKYSSYYINNYGFTLFGNYLKGDTNALFDNGYLYLYIQFGLIGLLFISGLIYFSCKYIKKTNDICKAIITICYLIYIFTESFSPNIFMNNMLFFSIPMIYKNNYYE